MDEVTEPVEQRADQTRSGLPGTRLLPGHRGGHGASLPAAGQSGVQQRRAGVASLAGYAAIERSVTNRED
ncbi:hypothetical protein GCM10027614_38460 [Micromonospora vulcania]